MGETDSEHEAQDELVEIGGRQYRVHPAAVFPIMSGREFDELVEDVRVNGLREPVVVSGDQLIDGRNRVRACAAAGVVPEVRELERGTDVASWVMSVNMHRRHLDASQRALLASRLSALSGEVTLIQAGELMGVSRASVARAAAVEKGPEPLRAAARDGVVSVGDAYGLRGEEPETIEQLVEDVRSGAAPNLRAVKRSGALRTSPGRRTRGAGSRRPRRANQGRRQSRRAMEAAGSRSGSSWSPRSRVRGVQSRRRILERGRCSWEPRVSRQVRGTSLRTREICAVERKSLWADARSWRERASTREPRGLPRAACCG